MRIKNNPMNEFEKLIDESIETYANSEIESTNEEHVFSKEHEKKMKKLFDECKARSVKTCSNTNFMYIKRVAIILIGIFLLLNLSTPCIHAWKIKIKEFFKREEKGYTMYVKDENLDNYIGYKRVTDEELVKCLDYIPENYELLSCDINKNMILLKFESKDDSFNMRITTYDFVYVDNERVYDEKIILNNQEVLYSKKDRTNVFEIYRLEYAYSLYGITEKEIMINVIENIDFEKLESIL